MYLKDAPGKDDCMKSQWIAICLLVLLVLSGCSQVVSNPTSTTSTKTLPALTDAPTRATTIRVVPTQTSTQITPISTTPSILSAEDAKPRLFDLLQTNGDCSLPCLLGFTPQVTSKQEIQAFLNQFVETEAPNMSILKTNSTDFKSVGFYIDMYLDLGILDL